MFVATFAMPSFIKMIVEFGPSYGGGTKLSNSLLQLQGVSHGHDNGIRLDIREE